MKKTTSKKAKSSNVPQHKTVSVLYQKIAGEVYAFAQVQGEIYFGKVPVKSSAISEDLEQPESASTKEAA